MNPPPITEAPVPTHTAEGEHRHHTYITSRIPWYVHLIWVSFWIVATLYIWQNLIPALQVEVTNPP